MGEALARCPRLALVPPDPVGVADAWERVLVAPGGDRRRGRAGPPGAGLLRGARPAAPARRLARRGAGGHARDAAPGGRHRARLGAGPSRFCAIWPPPRGRARGARASSRGADDLAGEPVALLRHRAELAALPEELERLGIATLGALAALPRAAVADRFGRPGCSPTTSRGGRDTPLRPRRPGEVLEEVLELEESSSGTQLERALELLVDRLLARRERDGRTLRVVVLGAALVEGGTWRERVVFREPLADPVRMRLVLAQRLALLPAPAETPAPDRRALRPAAPRRRGALRRSSARRQARLREAVRQARAAAGPEAALRVLAVDPDSRVPERRAVLTPFEV